MSKITKQRSQKSKNRTLKHLKNKNESTKKKKENVGNFNKQASTMMILSNIRLQENFSKLS